MITQVEKEARSSDYHCSPINLIANNWPSGVAQRQMV